MAVIDPGAGVNRLPTFTTNNIDNSIKDDSSSLKTTGFLPNTLINASQVNSYIKVAINGLNGIATAFYINNTTQNQTLDVDSTVDDWSGWITAGLNSIVKNIKVHHAIASDYWSRSMTLQLTGDITGSTSFNGSTNISLKASLNPYKIYRSAMFNSDGEVDLSQNGLYFKKFTFGTGDVLELGHIGYGSVVLFAYQESTSVVVMFTPHITTPWQGSSWQYPGGVNVSQYIYLYGHSYSHEYILTIQKDNNHSQYDNPMELYQRSIGSTSATWTAINSFTVYYAVIGIFQ